MSLGRATVTQKTLTQSSESQENFICSADNTQCSFGTRFSYNVSLLYQALLSQIYRGSANGKCHNKNGFLFRTAASSLSSQHLQVISILHRRKTNKAVATLEHSNTSHVNTEIRTEDYEAQGSWGFGTHLCETSRKKSKDVTLYSNTNCNKWWPITLIGNNLAA